MTKITFRFTTIGNDSIVGQSLRKFLTPESLDLVRKGA